MGELTGIIDLFCALLTAIIYSALLEQNSKIRANKLFRRMCPVLFIMLSFHGSAILFCGGQGIVYQLLEAFSFSGMYILMAFFTGYVWVLTGVRKSMFRTVLSVCYALCSVEAVIWFATCIRPFLFDIWLNKYVSYGFVFWFAQISGFLIVILNMATLLFCRSMLQRRDVIIVLLLPMLPLLSYITDLFTELRLRYVLIFVALFLNYLRVNLGMERRVQQHEKAEELYRMRATLERIKPHYIYNVLSSIYYLCESDPLMAQKATGAFADYMRFATQNMQGEALIPFTQELDTVRSYLQLENMRFGDRIRVHYDIAADDFRLPPFTLQPLVENSVKHGAAQTSDPADIYIETSQDALGWTMTVRDTCGGFDSDTAEPGTGTKYVSEILELTLNGTLTVNSTPGQGTVSVVRIPK
jgi:sensor histidine kinase YesM